MSKVPHHLVYKRVHAFLHTLVRFNLINFFTKLGDPLSSEMAVFYFLVQ